MELTDLKPVLVRTSIEVDELMVKIEKDKASAAETKAVVEAEKVCIILFVCVCI